VVGRNGEIGPAHFALGVRAEALSSSGRSLDEVERSHIEKVVAECEGNLSRAARVLEIDRTTLYHKLKRYRGAVTSDTV
jgi:two-component system response regulator HydG